MPYKKFKRNGKFCIENKNTHKITCFNNLEDEVKGIRIREAFAHGWKPKKMRK